VNNWKQKIDKISGSRFPKSSSALSWKRGWNSRCASRAAARDANL